MQLGFFRQSNNKDDMERCIFKRLSFRRLALQQLFKKFSSLAFKGTVSQDFRLYLKGATCIQQEETNNFKGTVSQDFLLYLKGAPCIQQEETNNFKGTVSQYVRLYLKGAPCIQQEETIRRLRSIQLRTPDPGHASIKFAPKST